MSKAAFSLENKRVWVAGHRGMVGSAIVRRLEREGCEIVTPDRSRLDLRNQRQVETWITEEKLDVIFLAAAKVGGILANDTYPADFLYDNLMIQTNVIGAAFRARVEKLIFLGSSCVYPKFAPQPITEESLLSSDLEPTNQWYAVAKIAGIKLCQAYRKQYDADFISAMPSNLYGPGDNFDLNSSHVIPALIRKAHEAKLTGAGELHIWGTGSPRREFLHVDDCADAVVFLAKFYSAESQINVGSGRDISILELAKLICCTVGFSGKIICDLTKPDGTPKKLMNSGKLYEMGWQPQATLVDGIRSTYQWFLDNRQQDLYVIDSKFVFAESN
jgi:GDP-L-fucose synthase